MKTIVISGINLFEGGPLSVYTDCLDKIIDSKIYLKNEIIAFVHKKELFEKYFDKIEIIELPKSRKNYLFRLWYEYVYFYFYSKNKNIHTWLSLHDITPNVKAKKRYVYCHNPAPFMKTEFKNIKYSYKGMLFSIFYKYLYKINIKKNSGVIVQQDWIRDEFIKLFKLDNVIVAIPKICIGKLKISKEQTKKETFTFIYPAFPRFFKNYEVICESCTMLDKKGVKGFNVLLTLDGSENKYSIDLKRKYGKLDSIKFIGLQERKRLFELYNSSDCMIFPSTLETWGLPISEFKLTGKPIMLSNLPYAKETIGNYNKVMFFEPNDAEQLSGLMEGEIQNRNIYVKSVKKKIEKPYAENWEDLFEIIF